MAQALPLESVLTAGTLTRADFRDDVMVLLLSALRQAGDPLSRHGTQNLGLAATVGSNALTVALKGRNNADPSATNEVTFSFRNASLTGGLYDVLNVSAAHSIVVPSTATLGTTSGVLSRIWVVEFNDGGTARLAVINPDLGSGVSAAVVNDAIASAVAIDTSSDVAGTFYAGAAVTSKPYRVLGYVESTQATAGTWASAPTKIQLWVPGIPLPGAQVVLKDISTAKTDPDVDDLFPIADSEAGWVNKLISLYDVLKIINELTADSAPSQANDKVVTYDADQAAAKSVLLKLIGTGRQRIPVPAAAMRPRSTGGCAELATVSAGAGQPDMVSLDFDSTTQEFAQFAFTIPKGWNRGTITADFVWRHPATATNFGVRWGLQAVAVSNDDAIGVAFGTAQEVTDAGGTTNDQYLSDETPAITVAGTPAAADRIYFQVYRAPAHAGDTMGVDASLLEVGLWITTNQNTDD